ncbi:MAG TPA: sodium-dependent transporter [Candidatus Intestinimonas stercorigallinarum]|nr:sodium-dependent transporter [Candidatus Intestinimonas stercorigallinarum]
MLERERFSSRLGFILISAGCAIGLGNVWRFPYIVGQYGGAAFVLVYLFFLVIMGLPIMVMEFSVGRASQKSILCSFQVLEPKGAKWHWYGWFGLAGNYLLMMFYTTIAGWLILYFIKMLKGDFVGLDTAGVAAEFGAVTADPVIQTVFMALVVVLGMLVCSRGLKDGVEKINKAMMVCLLVLLVVLAVRAVTLPNIFNEMPGGRLWGALFFVFMSFAAMSTVTAVFENIISCWMDKWQVTRRKAVWANLVLIFLLSLPCLLGFNVLSGFQPFGPGSGVLDLEDFIVSQNLLPLGSLLYLLFCVGSERYAWGYENFLKEADQGRGVRFPAKLRPYFTYILPLIVLAIFVLGYREKFF